MKSIKQLSSQRGMTLIEIMIVIVILGVLASMIAPNLLGQTERANMQKAVSDINTLEQQLELYRSDNYDYPTTEQGLEALVDQTDIEPLPRRFPEGGYIKRLPKDPWGSDYQLLNPGENGRMDVFSMGPDREPGTEDDIGNWNLGDFQ
ncbi:type II secretion system major pseudopilin GspG [Thalassotalea agarivorans]|uniref:Type II secretion system core protein G n=1 Tax=Thalassotalea agarivorans TaxID=349064 RepID=A0A1I0E499_THASX|nr:type II secretion system major pseudopilin GspG [Thalassotalea agarivorans]SET39762.1 type II secretion system protein G (GspG) [Thalassotalea agarivorans]